MASVASQGFGSDRRRPGEPRQPLAVPGPARPHRRQAASRARAAREWERSLKAAILLLIVLIWLPGAAMPGGGDGAMSFFLAIACVLLAAPWCLEILKGLHRTECRLIIAVSAIALVLMLLSTLSMLHAEYALRTMRTVFAHLFAFAILPAVAALSMRPAGANTVHLMVSVLIVMCVGMAALAIVGFGDDEYSDRAAVLFKHANQFGMALSASIPFLLARLVIAKRHRLLVGGCIVVVLIAMAKSGSKTNLLIGFSCVVLFLILYAMYLIVRRRCSLGVVAAVLSMPALVPLSALMLEYLNPRAFRLLTGYFKDGEAHSMDSRSDVWSNSIESGLSNPFTGVGAGQSVFPDPFTSHSHNIFLEYFRTLGVPGGAAITLLLAIVIGYSAWAVYCTIFRQPRSAASKGTDVMVLGASISLWNYIVANQMSDSFGPSTTPFFWFPLAFLMYYRGVQRSTAYESAARLRDGAKARAMTAMHSHMATAPPASSVSLVHDQIMARAGSRYAGS